MDRFFLLKFLLPCIIFFSSCKKDKEPELAVQVGEWEAHQSIDSYKGGLFYEKIVDADLEISILENENMSFLYSDEIVKYEWDLLEDWDKIVLVGDTIAVTGDTVNVIKTFDLVVDENDYQEWYRRWLVNDTIPNLSSHFHETITLQRK